MKSSSGAAYRKQAKQQAQQEEDLKSKLPKLDKFFKPQVSTSTKDKDRE